MCQIQRFGFGKFGLINLGLSLGLGLGLGIEFGSDIQTRQTA
jgi:hypothetical protein